MTHVLSSGQRYESGNDFIIILPFKFISCWLMPKPYKVLPFLFLPEPSIRCVCRCTKGLTK